MSAKKILVADDSDPSRELIREVLELSDYEVIEAADGAEALSRIRETMPDLVLMDIQMPRLNGYDVLRHLREDQRLVRLPVIALTAFAMQGDRERVLEAGFDGYITKPVDIARLRREVERFF
jgi:two-component system cell cycle response regulator DivK